MPTPPQIDTIAAIVVTWNGGDEAVAAVRSLLAQDTANRALTVVVVDNHSSDDTLDRIRTDAPGAVIVSLSENRGYGAAANAGMRAAAADAYVICNQDAEYQPGFVTALADALDRYPAAGAATAQVRLAGTFVPADETDPDAYTAHDGARWRRADHGLELLNSTGNQISRSGNGRDRGWLAPVGAEFDTRVFGFHGGAAMLRAEAVVPLGGFDERYFMYYEDTDLSFRLRRAGWQIVYAPEAVSVHQHASSSGTTSTRFVRWNTRNRIWCARRNGPASMQIAAITRTAIGAKLGLLKSLTMRGAGAADARALAVARVRGLLDGCGRLPQWAQEPIRPDAASQASATVNAEVTDRILCDFTSLPPKLGGVGRYLEGLATGLAELEAVPMLVVRPEHEAHFRALVPHASIVLAPNWIGKRGLRFVWEQIGLPQLARRVGATTIHSPHYTFPLAPFARGLRRVVTVHDATFFSDPDAHSTLKRVFFQAWIRAGVRADVQLIAPSRATADEVTKYAGAPRRDIVVAYHGVDREVFREPTADELAEFRTAHDLGDAPWIAFLGTIEPRKRVGELIRAHRELCAEYGWRDAEAPLLLISGQRGWDADAAAELDAAASDASRRVRELGYLPLDELRVLLGGSEAVVYASIAEGFGLPVLEAMASGAAVVSTRLSALPEVGGDAVRYVEPNAASIAGALQELLANDQLRADYARAGAERAAGFTWAACAATHLEAYRVALAG